LIPTSWSNIPKSSLREAPIPQNQISNGIEDSGLPAEDRPERTTWAWAIATLVGVGFWRPGSGTWASAITAGAWWACAHFFIPVRYQWFAATVLVCAVLIIGIPAAGIVARECEVEDPSHVVIDEVAGQLIALLAVPLHWQSVILSFILFRVFDIVKPPPLRRLETIEGGAGIVLDDVGAGLYALAIVQALVYWHVLG
jgi:phosphatidylglycerophosphatase A